MYKLSQFFRSLFGRRAAGRTASTPTASESLAAQVRDARREFQDARAAYTAANLRFVRAHAACDRLRRQFYESRGEL